MKKIISFILIMILFLFGAGCSKESYTLMCPSGIPLFAVGGVVDEFDSTVVSGPMQLSAELIKGDYNAIVAPINLGANLYKKGTLEYQLVAVLTEGNAYIISKKDKPLNSLNDLIGKKVYSFGEGGVPDKMLKYVVSNAGIDCEIINNGLDSAENLANTLFVNGSADYILSSEPVISNLKYKLGYELNVLNVSYEMSKLGVSFVGQAGLFVSKNNTSKQNKDIIKKIKDNVEGLEEIDDYIELLNSKDKDLYPLFFIFEENTLRSILFNSGIVFHKGSENKDNISSFLSILGINIDVEGFIYEE